VVASGFDNDRIALTREITQIILVSLIFHTISITVTYILNALYYFSFPAFTGLFHPIFNIASLYTLVPYYGIKAIAMAYLVSNALQACILLCYLRINTGWRLTSRIYHKQLPALFKNSSKMAATGFVWDLREIISRNIASYLPSGSVAILAYAEKIVSILFQLAVGPISRVFYSRVSDLITANMLERVAELIRKVVRINFVIIIFLSSGIILFLRPVLNAIFIRSRFTSDDIRMLYYLVLILLISLIVQSYKEHFVRVAFASKSIKTVATSAIFGLVTFTFTSLLFSYKYQVYGLAIAISLTQFFVSVVFYRFVNKLLMLRINKTIMNTSKPLVIAISCTILGLFIQNFVHSNIFVIFFMIL
jgi:putative peptidoglycan lipid II flippase